MMATTEACSAHHVFVGKLSLVPNPIPPPTEAQMSRAEKLRVWKAQKAAA